MNMQTEVMFQVADGLIDFNYRFIDESASADIKAVEADSNYTPSPTPTWTEQVSIKNVCH